MFTFLSRPTPQECVYNLIEQTVDENARGPPIYRSRFFCRVRQETACKKTRCFSTMGTPKTCLCPPQNYLKKHSRAPISIKSRAPRLKISTELPNQKVAEEGKYPPKPMGITENQNLEFCVPATEEETGNDECCDSPQAEQPPCFNTSPCTKPRVPRICCNILKPPVPCHTVEKLCPEDPKNYIHSNVVKAIRMPAKKAMPRYVFHPKGHVHNWDESGFPRKYVYKDSFGCVPSYIQEMKEGLRQNDQQAKYDMKFKERDIQSQVRHLEPTEHEAILCGLKKNWEEKYGEFQAMPLLIDTVVKTNKKKDLEDELKGLERDIQLLERHDHLFVSDTCRSFYLA